MHGSLLSKYFRKDFLLVAPHQQFGSIFDSEFCCGYCSGLNKNKQKVYNLTRKGWENPRVVADLHSSTYMVEYYYQCNNKACISFVDGKSGKKVFQKLSLFATYKVYIYVVIKFHVVATY